MSGAASPKHVTLRFEGREPDALHVRDCGVVVIDMSVTHPCCQSYVVQASRRSLAAASKREDHKIHVYQDWPPLRTENARLVPFVMEATGGIGDMANGYINDIAMKLAARPHALQEEVDVRESIMRELSVGLVIGNAMIMSEGRFMARRAHWNCLLSRS